MPVPFVISPNMVKALIMRRLKSEHPDWSSRQVFFAMLQEVAQ